MAQLEGQSPRRLRPSAAKIPFILTSQPQPDAAREGPGPAHPHAATRPGSTVPFKPSRIDPLNREPTTNPSMTVPFKPFRIDPLNREPTAKHGSTVPFKPSRIDPLNREPTAKPAPTAPSAAGSNAFSIAETAQPARALHPIALQKRREGDAPGPQSRACARSGRVVPRPCSRRCPTRALPDRLTDVLITHGTGQWGQRWRDALRGDVRW